jgi:hypothetical protein
MTVAGVVGGERAATGGVFVGGRGTASPGVGSVGVGGILPPGGIAAPALAATMFSQPIDVVIGHGDLDGLKLVVVSRK